MTKTTCITKQETRMLVRAWISFWYSDITRMAILFGAPFVLAILVLTWLGVDGEARKNGAIFAYVAMLVWVMVDNDYSQLNRIGLTVYRKPLASVKPAAPATHEPPANNA